jgi:hypothetical protein
MRRPSEPDWAPDLPGIFVEISESTEKFHFDVVVLMRGKIMKSLMNNHKGL